MYSVVRKHVRPNTTIPFFNARSPEGSSEEFKTYFRTTYVDTGKNLIISSDVSSDGLELTATSIWDSEESFNQFMSDPMCIPVITSAQEYLVNNGITEVVETSTI
jgi:hypothetical protein